MDWAACGSAADSAPGQGRPGDSSRDGHQLETPLTRLFQHLIVLAMVFSASIWQPDAIQSLLRERAGAHNAPEALVLSVARCETGGSWSPLRVGGLGERGLGQWLPGRGNHWDRTPAWQTWRIDIVQEYRERGDDPEVVWLDADMLAWSFGPEAESLYPGNWHGWSCAAL